ncbi:Ionotropic receptor 513 [Blattella germanica]|nr:Ionotropic receptor 513 [Blattella germanica]
MCMSSALSDHRLIFCFSFQRIIMNIVWKVVILQFLLTLKLNRSKVVFRNSKTSISDSTWECILNIVLRFFPSDLPMVVQTPDVWNTFGYFKANPVINADGDMLLRTLNEKYIDYIFVGPVPNIGDKMWVDVKPGSTVLLLANGNFEDSYHSLYYMMMRLHVDMRNVGMKIVVVSLLKTLTRHEQRSKAVVFLQILWKEFSCSDVVVLMPTPRHIYDSKYTYLNAITWFPSEQSDRCLNFLDSVNILDSWSSNDKSFMNKGNLFPLKSLHSMRDCTLKASAENFLPFSFVYGKVIGGLFSTTLNGFSEKTGIDIEFNNEEKSEKFAIEYPLITFGPFKLDECEYIYPYFYAEITFFVPSGEPIPKWQSLIKCLSLKVWILVIISYFLGSFTFYISVNLQNYRSLLQTRTQISQTFLLIFGTFLAVGIKENFQGLFQRAFFALWLFYCLQISTVYQSEMTAMMVNLGEQAPIRNLKELEKSDLKLMSNLDISRLIPDVKASKLNISQMKMCSETACFNKISNERNVAVLATRQMAELLILAYHSSSGKKQLVPLEENLWKFYPIIKTKTECMLNRNINSISRQFMSMGIYDYFFRQLTFLYTIYVKINQDRWKQNMSFSLNQFQGTFFLIFLGFIISTFTFLCEIKYSKMLY